MTSFAYVSPTGAGTGSGNGFANAAPWSLMQAVLDARADGDGVRTLSGPGYVAPAAPLNVSKRISLGGYNVDLTRGRSIIEGARTWPWPANGVWTDSGRYTPANAGAHVFNLKAGGGAGGGAQFDFLGFLNVGTPIRPNFGANSVLGDVTVLDCLTRNTNGLVYIDSSGDGQCTIHASRNRSIGYSQGMFRAFGGIQQDHCYGDARNQFHSPSTNLFGFHVQDAIAGVTTAPYESWFRDCTYLNHAAVPPAGSSQDPLITGKYGQGDNGVIEENTLLRESYRLVSRWARDRGLDVKNGIPEGILHDCYFDQNGFNIAAHDDTVEVYISDSYLGPTYRLPGDTNKSAPMQGSGHLTAVRCVIEQTSVGSNYLGAWYGTVQAAHVQSGVTIPQRTGKGITRDCVIRVSAGLSESLNSQGGSPVTIPTYAHAGSTRVETI